MSTTEKTVISGDRYTAKKWFLKFAYKVTETDVIFTEKGLNIKQGTAFAIVKEKTSKDIYYDEITSVTSAKKYSTPNVVAAVLIALLAVVSEVYAILAVASLFVFLGTTALVTINYQSGEYEIPVELKEDADALADKIELAVGMAKK